SPRTETAARSRANRAHSRCDVHARARRPYLRSRRSAYLRTSAADRYSSVLRTGGRGTFAEGVLLRLRRTGPRTTQVRPPSTRVRSDFPRAVRSLGNARRPDSPPARKTPDPRVPHRRRRLL